MNICITYYDAVGVKSLNPDHTNLILPYDKKIKIIKLTTEHAAKEKEKTMKIKRKVLTVTLKRLIIGLYTLFLFV